MSLTNDQIFQKCREQFAEMIAIRRDLHSYPEIGFELPRTSGIVADELRKAEIEVRTGVGRTGVVGDIVVPGAKRRIALRADMDALPMQETGNPAYKSRVDGKAHMCGHDGHTSMLLGAARILSRQRNQLKVNVRFIFQPNEENFPGGAPAMIEDGALDHVDEIYGLHVWPVHPTGQYGICIGPALGQPDVFEIEIIGRGGHAAMPHLTIDPILIGAQFISAAQAIIARTVSPLESAVVSFTQFHGGTTHNVIPERIKLVGTVRTYKNDVRQAIWKKLEDLLNSLTAAYGASYTIRWEDGYPVTFNHEQQARQTIELTRALVGSNNVIAPDIPSMGGEDFAYYLQKVPGCFVFLGVRNEEKGFVYGLHDSRFDFDEEAMVYGAALHVGLALQANA